MSARLISREDLAAFGRRLVELRRQRNWTQDGVAARVGCSQRAVSLWEYGNTVPPADFLAGLADAFGISMDELWGRKP